MDFVSSLYSSLSILGSPLIPNTHLLTIGMMSSGHVS